MTIVQLFSSITENHFLAQTSIKCIVLLKWASSKKRVVFKFGNEQ